MDNRLRLTTASDSATPASGRRRRRPTGPGGAHPWQMSEEARRTGREGIALARRELQRVRAHLETTHDADAA